VYDPPPPYDSFYPDRPYPDSLYDGEVTYLDHYIGELVHHLEENGLYDRTVIVFSADHGEGLGQHQEMYHDQFIYDSTLRVPFIVGGGAAPESWPSLVLETVQSLDILPTLLQLAGVRPKDDVQGESLVSLMLGESWNPVHYMESHSPKHNLCVKLYGLRKDGWKYIEAPTPELYNVDEDPGETNNLADRHVSKASELREILLTYSVDESTMPEDVDFETRRKLEAIGYIQRTARRVSMARENKADPKDMAKCINGLHMSMLHFTFGEFDSSLAVSLRLKEIFPGQSRIYDNIGNLQIRMGLYDDAIREFERIAIESPSYAKGYFWGGMAHMKKRQDDQAIEWFSKAIALDENLQVAHYNLGVILARNGELQQAIPEFEKTVQIASKAPLAQLARQALADILDAARQERGEAAPNAR